MNISNLREVKDRFPSVELEKNERLTFILQFGNVQLTGRNIYYPNCLLYTENKLINPYDERVMSLKKDSFYDGNLWDVPSLTYTKTKENPVFFFIYNVDNYYHFLYDSMPILNSYFELKKSLPNLELLLQTSHPSKEKLPPFVLQFLESLGIEQFEYAKNNILYTSVYVSSSYTHGGKSNDPPSSLSYAIWSYPKALHEYLLPKRFYISRRSWIHGKTDNIGTNYTTRRKCMNEDDIVLLLKKYGIEEIFTELLTTDEKIALFKNAELVVGIIGGGMCNLLFAPESTKSLCIVTPHFLTINQRFQYSMNHTNILYSHTGELYPYEGLFPLYSRVKIKTSGKIGEVEEYKENQVRLTLSSNDVAGFSQDFPMESIWISQEDCEAVDSGLNSPFQIQVDQLEKDLNRLLNAL